ncbi:hypothetical protein AAKU67_003659 [Oxalobacteraceae bacterium GrIS 2.11]
MKSLREISRAMPIIGALLCCAVLAACGSGGQAPILGLNTDTVVPVTPPVVIAAPTVSAVAPANNSTGVPLNNVIIVASFSEPVAPITGTASFTLTCSSPCVSPVGTVALDPTNSIASLTLATGTVLMPGTLYTATVTGVKSLTTGLALTSPYSWCFTTGLTTSATRPSVIMTAPLTATPPATLAANAAISASFSQDMAPASISGSSFTLSCTAPCVAPSGNVSYITGSRTAVFSPSAALAVGTLYTATITTGATDLASNALGGNQAALPAASNYVWKFTAGTATPVAHVTVVSTNPGANANGVCTNAAINAQFGLPAGLRMDPTKVNNATFVITGPAPAFTHVAASSVVLDASTGTIATFTPVALVAGQTYTATIVGGANGVADLAAPADTMVANYKWNFTAASCTVPPVINLGSASTFGEFGGGAGMTNRGIYTVINGNIGTTAGSTLVTGFHDTQPNCSYDEKPLNIGAVNGLIFTKLSTPPAGCAEANASTEQVAFAARADTLAAYNQLVAMPAGPNPGAGNLANLTLAPGDYTAASGSFMIEGGNLTLDAQGNANAVWVFQMASTLIVGGPGAAAPASIILANGAQAKNVFWQVGSAATINAGGGGTMVGTIISQSGVTISTAGNVALVTLNGRALSLGASVTVVNTVVNVPSP